MENGFYSLGHPSPASCRISRMRLIPLFSLLLCLTIGLKAQQGTSNYCIFYYDHNFCCVSGDNLLSRSDLEPRACLFFSTPTEDGYYISTTEEDETLRRYFCYDEHFGTMELGSISNATVFTIENNRLKDANGNCFYYYNSHWMMTDSNKNSYYTVTKTEKPLSTDLPVIDGIDDLDHLRTYSFGASGARYQCAFDKWKTERIGLTNYTVYTDPRDFSSNLDHFNADITYSWSLSGIDPQYATVTTTGDIGEVGVVHYLQSVAETTEATLTVTATATGGWPVAPAGATIVSTKPITFEPINASNTTTEYCVIFNDGWFLSHEGTGNNEMAARQVFNPKTCVFERTGTDLQINNTIKTIFNGTTCYLYHSSNNNTNLSLDANNSSYFYVDPNYDNVTTGNPDWVLSTDAPNGLGFCWRVNYNDVSNWWDLAHVNSSHPYHPIEVLDFPSDEVLPEITEGDTLILATGSYSYAGSEATYRSPYLQWLGSYDIHTYLHPDERFDIWGIKSNVTTGDPLPDNELVDAVIDHYEWTLTTADGSDFSAYATVDASTGVITYNNSVIHNTLATLRLTAYVQEGTGEPKAAANVTLYTEMDILFVPYEFTDEGNGTQNDPYVIHNAEELIAVRDMNNAGVDFSDTYFILADDISLADVDNWEPIGTDDNPFQGHFNGDGHTITDMTIDTEDGDAGFFGYVKDGEISNLGITDSNIEADGPNAGAICGRAEYTTFTNCFNSADVDGGENVGGICGSSTACFFDGCVNTGDIAGDEYVGGICGHTYYSTIEDCYNAGNIDGDNAGGIGYMQGSNTISGCINTGSVEGQGSGPIYAGASGNYSNNYFDKQLCPDNGGTQTGATGLLTTEMTGTALQNSLGEGWTYAEGMYPRPSNIADTPTALAAAAPIWLDSTDSENYDTVNEVNTPFTVQNDPAHNITWGHYGSGTALDCSAISFGYVSLAELGNDTLACYVDGELYKLVPVVVNNTGSWGTEDNPYVIHDADELAAVRDLNNDGEDYTDTYFVLSDDIDLSGDDNWEPIGTEDNPFKGHFDGDGHVITNMTIDTDDDDAGLFGYVEDGEISNLGVTNSNIDSDGDNAGAICGRAENTTFTNCYNDADVNGDENVGGICGNSTGCEFDGCVNTGDITGEEYVGGISGNNTSCDFDDCYNAGNIDGDNAGGIGYMDGDGNTIDDCINTGSVAGEGSGPIYAGDNGTYSNNYYDKQLCPNNGGTQTGATGLLTNEMTGTALQDELGEGWTYADGMYPRPTEIADTPTAIAAATPIWLASEDDDNYDTVNDVNTPFTVQNDADLNVTWEHYGNGTALDCSDIENGYVSLAELGNDTLACYVNGELYRLVPVVVNNTGSFYRFTGEGDDDDWTTPENWAGTHDELPGANDIIIIEDDCTLDDDATVKQVIIDDPDDTLTVPDGVTLDADDIDTNDPNQLVIEDGGQVYTNSDDTYATFHIIVEKYTDNTNGWVVIASPMNAPQVQNLTANSYDIYSYDEDNDQMEWQNLKAETVNFTTGASYLYANSAAQGENSTDLIFKGILTSDRANANISLSYAAVYEPIKGYNLVGNPYAHDITIGDITIGGVAVTEYYRLVNGTDLVRYTTEPIKAGEGFFIKATAAGQNTVISVH